MSRIRSVRRALPLLALAGLAGCEALPAIVPHWLGVEAASVMLFQRGVGDMAYSALAGRDCSIVRLDRGESYCRAVRPAHAAQPVCTRSLGVPDCWANPEALPVPSRRIADARAAPTAEQEAWRTRSWPGL